MELAAAEELAELLEAAAESDRIDLLDRCFFAWCRLPDDVRAVTRYAVVPVYIREWKRIKAQPKKES